MEVKCPMENRRGNVLIVDDDETIGETISLILQNEEYATELARNGKEALEKVRSKFYDVALLDIKLPDMEGTYLLKAIRELAPTTVKIMLTGYPELRTSVDALNWGADAYLIKPISPCDIIKTIEEKLRKVAEARTMTEQKMSVFLRDRTKKLLQESE
jgi:DNA-binding response OmpR family regulator